MSVSKFNNKRLSYQFIFNINSSTVKTALNIQQEYDFVFSILMNSYNILKTSWDFLSLQYNSILMKCFI
jgi:hypothetical protein